MTLATPRFYGPRLREALEARAITSVNFSAMLGVSKSAVSQYIHNLHAPSPAVMAKICAILNLPAHFFTASMPEECEPRLFWRSRASATKAVRTAIARKYRWFRRIVGLIESFIEFPNANLPDLHAPTDPTMLTDADIEDFAMQVRRFWKLGDGPISNVVGLIENNGGVVVRNELGDERLDAFSDWDGNRSWRSYIVLGTDKESAVRSRYNAAHELAHTVLHRHVPDAMRNKLEIHNLMERQADLFAGAFLLPAATFASEVYAASLESLLALKLRWRVSMASMVMRLWNLNQITEERRERLFVQISRKGWRKKEPLDDSLPIEEPKMLRRSLDLILDNGLSRAEEMILFTHLSQLDIERLLGVNEGYLSEPPASIKLDLRSGFKANQSGRQQN